MKAAPFDYKAPTTAAEALSLLAEHGYDAKILAGGQTLGPLLNMRMAAPEIIIDINNVRELDYQRREADGSFTIGALTRQGALEDDGTLASHQPLVAATIPYIAHRAIRNRGTVAGSLSHADPAAEWTGLVTVLEAELVLKRAGSDERVVAARDFFQGPLTTALEPEELLAEIRLPAWPADRGWAFMEFSRRHGDFALAGAFAVLGLDASGCCTNPRLALIGVEETPVRLRAVEELLNGARPDEKLLAEAARLAGTGLNPIGDLHASADYRRHLASEFTRRVVAGALERARH